jgi:DNA mismatch repair protein MSH6
MFRQIRPKELIHAKVSAIAATSGIYRELTLTQGNLSVPTTRLLRHTLPSSTLWQSFREGREFYSADDTITHLAELFQSMLETPLAMEALGGMLFYLKSLNLDKDLVSQKNFNIYDPIKEGKNLVLEGVTLNHMEVSRPRSLLSRSLFTGKKY